MAVFRVHKLDNYTKVNNHLVRDDISLKAKGMMLILLSLPNDWKYSVSGLSAICKEARNTINNILNELEEKEYLERTRIYEGRQIKEWKYDIYEVPKSLYLKYEDIKYEDIKSLDIKNEAQLIKDILSKEELNTCLTDVKPTFNQNSIVENNIDNNIIAHHQQENLSKKASNSDDKHLSNFEILWEAYPRKQGKSKAYNAYLKFIGSGKMINNKKIKLSNKQIINAFNKFLDYLDDNNIEEKYIPYGSTFFNTTILDYVEERHDE